MGRLFILPALAVLPVASAMAQSACVGCAISAPAPDIPLEIEIFSDLTFSRLALTGDGAASAGIDAQSGARSTQGGIITLGGQAVQGRGRITGAPGRAIRLSLPTSVTMTSTTGGTAELTDFTTDLPSYPVLDSSGSLEFAFGGRLRISGPLGGNLRGRIPITVDYN